MRKAINSPDYRLRTVKAPEIMSQSKDQETDYQKAFEELGLGTQDERDEIVNKFNFYYPQFQSGNEELHDVRFSDNSCSDKACSDGKLA